MKGGSRRRERSNAHLCGIFPVVAILFVVELLALIESLKVPSSISDIIEGIYTTVVVRLVFLRTRFAVPGVEIQNVLTIGELPGIWFTTALRGTRSSWLADSAIPSYRRTFLVMRFTTDEDVNLLRGQIENVLRVGVEPHPDLSATDDRCRDGLPPRGQVQNLGRQVRSGFKKVELSLDFNVQVSHVNFPRGVITLVGYEGHLEERFQLFELFGALPVPVTVDKERSRGRRHHRPTYRASTVRRRQVFGRGLPLGRNDCAK